MLKKMIIREIIYIQRINNQIYKRFIFLKTIV